MYLLTLGIYLRPVISQSAGPSQHFDQCEIDRSRNVAMTTRVLLVPVHCVWLVAQPGRLTLALALHLGIDNYVIDT